MSRSGYYDDAGGDDPLDLGRWRGIIASATRGKRGQAFFRELVAALDAMPEKRLIRNKLEEGGEVCPLGALGRAKAVDLSRLMPHLAEDDELGEFEEEADWKELGKVFNVAPQLTQEVMYWNDETTEYLSPEERWVRIRRWAAMQIVPLPEELEPQ